jgi:hypothetical protein
MIQEGSSAGDINAYTRSAVFAYSHLHDKNKRRTPFAAYGDFEENTRVHSSRG